MTDRTKGQGVTYRHTAIEVLLLPLDQNARSLRIEFYRFLKPIASSNSQEMILLSTLKTHTQHGTYYIDSIWPKAPLTCSRLISSHESQIALLRARENDLHWMVAEKGHTLWN